MPVFTRSPVNNDGLPLSDELQKFAQLGRLSAALIHDISSPLNAALIYLEQVNDMGSMNVKAARRSLMHLDRYINAARNQLKGHSEASGFYINGQVSEVRHIVAPLAKRNGVKLEIEKGPRLKLPGSPVKFNQIIVNLLVNAIESYPAGFGGEKTVSLRISAVERFAEIEVRDNGAGIPKDKLGKIFGKFYTSKGGAGLGLGLMIVHQNVQGLGGRIKVASSKTKGTRFKVRLPIG
jgi:uncharacterized protein